MKIFNKKGEGTWYPLNDKTNNFLQPHVSIAIV